MKVSGLEPGSFVAHVEFMVQQGVKLRPCTQCTDSGWNLAQCSKEKLALCSVEDPVAFAALLLACKPQSNPRLAVADEDAAYTN